MRIAFCSHEFVGLRGGGIGTYVGEAAKALAAAGHEAWLVTSAASEQERQIALRAEGLHRVLFVEDAKTPAHEVRFGMARTPLRFAQLAHDVLRQSGAAFDYVEFADYGAWGAVAVQEQRLFDSYGDAVVAVVLHSPSFECWRYNEVLHLLPPSDRETAVLEDETIRRAPAVWAPSRRLRDMVAERLGLRPDFAEIVRYPMALSAELPAGPSPRARLEDLKFLYFGRIEPRKGVRQLVDAFARMPELSIECIGGDGATSPLGTSEVEYLRRRATPNVTFSGPLPRQAMLERLRAADVVVLPSTWENWPNTCIEAMAAGRVVIGGRNGGMAEMIEHGSSGLLVDGSDPADLVRVVREDLRLALGRLDAIGAAAARRSRELSSPADYAARIAEFVRRHRGAGRAPARPAARALVSFVVPFHGESPEVIGEAVDSAIRQTHRDLEILVVDDGSPRADAAAILDGLARRDGRVRILRKANGGLASARNHAIEHAHGEFVLCLDGDNVARPEYAATGLEVFLRCPEAMAVVPRFLAFEDGARTPLAAVQALPFDRPLAIFRNSGGDAGAMFRRAVFAEHGLRYDPRIDVYSDWGLWLDMARRGLQVQIVPRVLYDYRLRKGSLMDEHAWRHHLAMLGVLIEHHLPPGDGSDERAMLVNLARGWGVGALLATLGRRPVFWEDPVRVAQHLRPDAMRYRLAEALGKIADRAPALRHVAHHLLATLFQLHGRWKDRRRGRAADRRAAD